MDQWMDGWKHGSLVCMVYRCKDVRMDGRHVWMGGGSMDGWMDAWMDILLDWMCGWMNR